MEQVKSTSSEAVAIALYYVSELDLETTLCFYKLQVDIVILDSYQDLGRNVNS